MKSKNQKICCNTSISFGKIDNDTSNDEELSIKNISVNNRKNKDSNINDKNKEETKNKVSKNFHYKIEIDNINIKKNITIKYFLN